jgi:hypothetical protein
MPGAGLFVFSFCTLLHIHLATEAVEHGERNNAFPADPTGAPHRRSIVEHEAAQLNGTRLRAARALLLPDTATRAATGRSSRREPASLCQESVAVGGLV